MIPFIDVVRRSFLDAIGEQFLGFENYKITLENEIFLIAVKNTLRFVSVCIPLLLVLSLILAVLLHEVVKVQSFLKGAFLLPMAVPVASIVFMWKILFHKNGLINGIFGLGYLDWMNTDSAFVILVGSYIWKNLGYHIVLWMAALNGISKSLYEAAGVDGAGWWKKFIYITLPGLKNISFTVIVLAFLNSFKVFREAWLVSGDYPHRSIYLLQHLFNNWFRELSLNKLSAGSVITALFLLLIIVFLRRSWRKKETIN